MIKFDDIVLSIFPQVTTHLKHVKNDHASQLFPYDGIIAVAAVTYCRYTVRFPSESKPSRIIWSIILGYLAYNRYDYWLQFYVYLLSFGEHFYLKACQYFPTKVSVVLYDLRVCHQNFKNGQSQSKLLLLYSFRINIHMSISFFFMFIGQRDGQH
jgi:hypothetical protein